MKRGIKERYSGSILGEACHRFGLEPEETRLLGGFESFVFRARDGVLRISHSIHRTPDEIEAELDYVTYLAAEGVPVAAPIARPDGTFVARIADDEGGTFIAAMFKEAVGESVWDTGGWNTELLRKYGRTIGLMHSVSKSYEPRAGNAARPHWDAQMRSAAGDAPIEAKLSSAIAAIHAIGTDPANYHMIHQDPHFGNLHVDATGAITLFDFDDCAYGHAAYDLAMTVFYEYAPFPTKREMVHAYWNALLDGYLDEHDLDRGHLAAVPLFLKLREIELYHTIRTEMDNNEREDHPWVRAFMDGRRERIVAEAPVLEYDFTGGA